MAKATPPSRRQPPPRKPAAARPATQEATAEESAQKTTAKGKSQAKKDPDAPPTDSDAKKPDKNRDETRYDWRRETAKAGLASMIGLMPAWLVSLLFHAVAVPVLAVVTFSSVSDTEEVVIASQPVEVTEDLEEVAEFDVEPLEDLEINENMTFDSPQVDPGAIDFGEMAAPAEVLDTNISDMLVADTAIGEIGALFGDEGEGMSSVGEGLKGAAMFFGTKSEGNRFCFLVDNSNSMGSGKLETALLELGKAVNRLSEQQYFYIIFYSDTAYPLFHPEQVPDMVRASDENKRRVAQWLPQIEMCLRTDCEDAMKMALTLRPDVIYILGDGAFTDNTASVLIANPIPNVIIHTLGMNVRQNVVADFAGIAAKHKGTYKDVGISPQGQAMAKQFPRPKHRTRQSIWGLKLPLQK